MSPLRLGFTAAAALAYVAFGAALGARVESDGDVRITSLALPPANAVLPDVVRVIERDPFARPHADSTPLAARAAVARTYAPLEAPGLLPSFADATTTVPDVPDAGAGDGSPDSAAGTTATLRATIVGSPSVGYVQQGTALTVVRVGDTVAGRRIARIDLHGLRFADGSHLDVSGDSTPAPRAIATPAAAHAARDAAARMRSRLRVPLAEPRLQTPTTSGPQAVPTPPSPGPLPTVVPYPLPVGVSPTADPNGPTPYPLPPLRPPYPSGRR